MKKLFALILALAMILSLAACGKKADDTAKDLDPAEKAAAEAEIRYALGLLFDRNYIVTEISQGGEVPASSFVAMGMTDADGSEFYKNAGSSDKFDGYYDVSKDDMQSNFDEAIATLKKYYKYDNYVN